MEFTSNKQLIQASIVIPVFNEDQNIKMLIEEIKEKLENKVEMEIIVVDDGSSDGTYFIVREMGVKVIRLKKSRGKGAAFLTGAIQAAFPNIVFFGSSGEIDPNQIINCLLIMSETKADIAMSFDRIETFGSVIFSFIFKLLYGYTIRNFFSDFFCLRKKVLKNLSLTEKGTFLSLEILAEAASKGYTVVEFYVKPRMRLIYKREKTLTKFVQLYRTFVRSVFIKKQVKN